MKELKEFSSEEEYVPRSIQYIVVHCSATRANIPFTEEQLLKCHLQRGFKYIGYHFYITRDGELHHCRPVSEPGAHVRGFVSFGVRTYPFNLPRRLGAIVLTDVEIIPHTVETTAAVAHLQIFFREIPVLRG